MSGPRAPWRTLAVALALVTPPVAGAAPVVTDPVLSPTSWSRGLSAGAVWEQTGFGTNHPGPASIEARAILSAHPWLSLSSLPGPLRDGTNGDLSIDVRHLEGEYAVRLVIAGLDPVALGTLRLDRTPPAVTPRPIAPASERAMVAWQQQDAGAGSAPDQPPVVEVNTSPAGDAGGMWRPFDEPSPVAGDRPHEAHTATGDLGEGPHLVRVNVRDAIGNAGVHPLGTLLVDRTPPVITGVSVRKQAVDPRLQVVEVSATVADPGGAPSGIARVTVAPMASPDGYDWAGRDGAPHPQGRYGAATPGAGVHVLVVRAWDRAGNRTESPPVSVRVLTDDEYRATLPPPPPRPDGPPRPSTAPPGGEPGTTAGRPAGAGTRWAWTTARRFHQRRAGLALAGRPRTVATMRGWRSLLGTANAGRYAGYTTPDGQVLLGPAATAGLRALQRARTAPRGARPPSRADLDRMVMGLAVLLHESLHATGPALPHDYHLSAAGRALEEGLTEAATVDLLRRYVAALRLPPRLAPRLRAATRRYRPAYRNQVLWVRRMSGQATAGGGHTAAARAWRIRAADTWGEELWQLLATALAADSEQLRARAPEMVKLR